MRKRDLAYGVLLAIVLVGAVRQGKDAKAVRLGATEPVFADTVSIKPVAGTFAVPKPPASTAAKLAAALWSGPLTFVGFSLALAGGVIPTYDPVRACWVACNVGGPSAVLQRRVNADAHTLGQVVLCRLQSPSAALLDHESAHVRQAERFGLAMPLAYGLFTAARGYANNPFEISARNFAADRNTAR